MKINEVITEDRLRKDSRYALPNMRIHPQLDNSSPYMAYRFGVALAGAPVQGTDKSGPTGQKLLTIGYTEADDDIVQAAEKMMGIKSVEITSKQSKEVPLVNTRSPIQPKGPIKRKGKWNNTA